MVTSIDNPAASALSTFFAPASRANDAELRRARKAFLDNEIAVALLEAVPGFAAVLNPERQIIAANRRFLEALGSDADTAIGLRPGEVVGCQYCDDGPGGCGTGRYCMHCGAVDAIEECLRTHKPITRECRILTRSGADGGAMELDVQATYIRVSDMDMLVLAMRDVSGEKRRQVLERIFFHDVLNTATGLHAAAQLLNSEDAKNTHEQCAEIVLRLTRQIVEEISAQQQLSAAEQGELHLVLSDVRVIDLLQEVVNAYCHGKTSCPVNLGDLPDCLIKTDFVILRRVLGNLVKNAIEATPADGSIVFTAARSENSVTFKVHNPVVMPEAVQRQVFQRSFSTKQGRGRGVGTYSVKLFTERYLGGQVRFTSNEDEGTTFYVTLPLNG